MSKMNQKLMDRVMKLRAMAQDATSENEAMIAARRLHALLSKHGLSMSDLDAHGDPMGQEATEEITRKMGGGAWVDMVANAVSKMYFCKVYCMGTGGTGRVYVMVGSDSYRSTATSVFNSLVKGIDTNARLSSKTERPKHVDGWAYITSYRNAAAQRVYARCMEIVKQGRQGTLQDEDGSTLPALASLYDTELQKAQAWMEQQLPGMRARKTGSRTSSTHGASNGKRYGDRVRLGNEVSKHAPKMIK